VAIAVTAAGTTAARATPLPSSNKRHSIFPRGEPILTKPASGREAALAALREGLPAEVAAEGAGVSPSTVRTWIRKGRRDPGGEFGAFARAVESEEGDGAMTVEEIERHLATIIRRKQSVAAMKLWLELHHGGRESQDDELSWLDPQ
jgi:hypothetical protein